MPAPPDYLIRLRPLASPEPVETRIRILLKIALRSLRLRCITIEEIKPKGVDDVGKQDLR